MNYIKFPKCPNINCNINVNGFTIYQCKSCSKYYCFKSGGFFTGIFTQDLGCGSVSNNCPHCGEYKKSIKIVGYIENELSKF